MLLRTLGCMYLFKLVFSLFSDIYPRVELLGHMVVLFLVLWEASILFSTVAAPIYIPANSIGGFPFLHILASIWYLCSFWWHSNRCELMSHCGFDLHFSFLKNIHLFIYLAVPMILVAACGIFSCNKRDLIPWPGIESRPPALGAQSIIHWTSREVPEFFW